MLNAFIKTLLLGIILLPIAGELKANSHLEDTLWAVQSNELHKTNTKFFKRLLKRFDRNQIIGLEVVLADTTNSKFESRFGHSMIHFVDNIGDTGNDLMLSFVANVTDPKLSYLGGVFGKYSVYPLVKSFRLFHNDYVKNQNRSLKRIVIPSNEKVLKNIHQLLKNWWDEIERGRPVEREKALANALKKAKKLAKKRLGKNNFVLKALNRKDENDSSYAVGIWKKNTPLTESELFSQAKERLLLLKSPFLEQNEYLSSSAGTLFFISPSTSDILLTIPQDIELTEFIEQTNSNYQLNGRSYSLLPLYDEGKITKLLLTYLPHYQWAKSSEEAISPLMVALKVKGVKSKIFGKYKFLSQNCAGALVKFLKYSGLPHKKMKLFAGRIPTKLPIYLRKSLLNPYPAIILDSPSKLAKKLAPILKIPTTEVFKSHWKLKHFNKIDIILSAKEKLMAMDLHSNFNEEFEDLWEDQDLGSSWSFSKIYDAYNLDPRIYSICKNQNCLEDLKPVLEEAFPVKELRNTLSKQKKYLKRRSKGLNKLPNLRFHLQNL